VLVLVLDVLVVVGRMRVRVVVVAVGVVVIVLAAAADQALQPLQDAGHGLSPLLVGAIRPSTRSGPNPASAGPARA
jgi:hypothetical protein